MNDTKTPAVTTRLTEAATCAIRAAQEHLTVAQQLLYSNPTALTDAHSHLHEAEHRLTHADVALRAIYLTEAYL